MTSTTVSQRHPVIRQEYAVYTPPMDEIIATIGNWIDQRITGGYIFGPSRWGKSRMIKWHVRSVLRDRFRTQIPLVIWIRTDSVMTEAEFLNTLLGASQFEFYDPLHPKTKTSARFLFMEQLITMARSARCNYVVLIIDEAHDMSLKELKWLLGIQNLMDKEGFRLSVISIGSHGLLYQPNYLVRTGNSHIAARFFAYDMRFRGLVSALDLGFVLAGYDVDSEWPKKSGRSYLQYFAEEAFERGERLEHHKEKIWSAFIDLMPNAIASNPKTAKEVPMQHVAYTVEAILKRLAAGEPWCSVLDYDSLLKMIEMTKFADHMAKVSHRD